MDFYNDTGGLSFPSLEEQIVLTERYGLSTLLFCPDSWALRHRFVNEQTGEAVRARCNSWSCLYCGPRKVDQWRQLVKAAEPTLFLTLTKAGQSVEVSARALTTFLQHLRRGSKGRGPYHVGAREAYPVEYFGVLERHRDFEQIGFHWHLLLRGVDYIPHDVLRESWRSATHGNSYIVHIEAVRKPHVIGYVTKYLMKSLSEAEKGSRQVKQERMVYSLDENGQKIRIPSIRTVTAVSQARRIRYSRQFFPERVADLRARLFSQLDETALEEQGNGDEGKPLEDEVSIVPSSWQLFEQEKLSGSAADELDNYERRRREALRESLEDIRVGRRDLSRRVINVWAYQRSELRKRT